MDRGTEWLYTPKDRDKEEYLLGRRIDRHTNPSSLVCNQGASPVANGVVDLTTKIKEDPLLAIRMTEEAKRKAVINNPVKVSQIRQQVSRADKYSAQRSRSPHTRHTRHRRHFPHTRHTRHNSHSPNTRDTRHNNHASRTHPRSHSPNTRDTRHNRHSHQTRLTHHSRRSEYASHSSTLTSKESQSQPRRMEAAELERRRQEMMDNAKEKRTHRQIPPHSSEEPDQTKEQGPHFLQSLRVKSLSTSTSLGDRIHRNIQSVQRTKAGLDSDFL